MTSLILNYFFKHAISRHILRYWGTRTSIYKLEVGTIERITPPLRLETRNGDVNIACKCRGGARPCGNYDGDTTGPQVPGL